MSDIKTAIMDAAERRMQAGGFGGFSFREIASDVGIKSSSVHYHFPTKEDVIDELLREAEHRIAAAISKLPPATGLEKVLGFTCERIGSW